MTLACALADGAESGLPPGHPAMASPLKPAGRGTARIRKWRAGKVPRLGPGAAPVTGKRAKSRRGFVPDSPAASTKGWAISFLVTLFAMTSLQVSNLGFSPLIPAIQKDFALSVSQVGLFAGMYGMISVFVSVPAGLAIRRIGEKTALAAGLVVVALGLGRRRNRAEG